MALSGAALALTVSTLAAAGIGVGAAGALPNLPIPHIPGLTPPPVSTPQLTKSFDRAARGIVKDVPGRLGVAITPVGGDATLSFGSLRTARAWSTLKVPVSIAAQRAHGAAVGADIAAAIRKSDNAAAEKLWGSLGGGQRSVDAVTAVIREGHDGTTHVNSEIDEPHSYPGATDWPLIGQSVFAAHLPCLPDSGPVLGHMRAVEANQRWGVKTLRKKGVTTAVKGGWGPVSDATGKYVVRQLAVVTTPTGQFAVSMAALPKSGSFEDGTAMLTRVGRWIGANLAKLPVGRC